MLGLEPYEEEIDTMQIPSSDLDFIIKMDNTPNSLEYLMRGASGTSIVIPNKGNITNLSRCIAQMSGYATGDFEIIVADRGTTDLDTLEYYKTIKDAVKIVDASEPNFSKAMNNVIENHLTFNRLMFINSNANPTEDVISKMNKAWTKEVGVVGMPIKDKESKYEMVSVDCMMMPTELFEEMGGFDESYLEHFQGEDLCLKIKERGYDISICPEVEPLEVNDDAISNIGDSETLDNRWGNLN
jgi:GT2 family glycosyltransferase